MLHSNDHGAIGSGSPKDLQHRQKGTELVYSYLAESPVLTIADVIDLLNEALCATTDEYGNPEHCCDRCMLGEVDAILADAFNLLRGIPDDLVLVRRSTWNAMSNSAGRESATATQLSNIEYRLAKRMRRVPREVRMLVTERDQGRCRYCALEVGTTGEMDHYEPDGPSDIYNLVLACKPCNIKKSDTRPAYLKKLHGLELLPIPGQVAPGRRPLPNGFARPRERTATAMRRQRS